jgi:hypothetical protein
VPNSDHLTTDEIDVLIRVVKHAGDTGKPHGIGPVTLLQILQQLRDEHVALIAKQTGELDR